MRTQFDTRATNVDGTVSDGNDSDALLFVGVVSAAKLSENYAGQKVS
jgi:hypothetical protein